MSKQDIYTYDAKWLIYSLGWSLRQDHPTRLAIGSFVEEYNNRVEIIQLDPEADKFVLRSSFDHPYPATKLRFMPDQFCNYSDLLATTADYLRLWEIGEDGHSKLKVILNNNKASEYCAPLTGFDWSGADPNVIGTCSIDHTCTVWDISQEESKTQLIAHDKEVFDMAFVSTNPNIFATVGADPPDLGSLRMFDLRNLDHSTIMYETTSPLVRMSWNAIDPNYIACVALNDNKTVVIDIRSPQKTVAELAGHDAAVNSVSWAPHTGRHLCTAADDKNALIWELPVKQKKKPLEPILSYEAGSEINNLQWSPTEADWIAIAFDRSLQILRV